MLGGFILPGEWTNCCVITSQLLNVILQIQAQTDLTIPARNSCANSLQVIIPRKEDAQRNKDERTQKRRNNWDSSRQGQNGKDQAHEGQNHRDRGGEYYQSSRKREREREPRGAHPPNSFGSSSKQQQKLGTSLPPPPYPPPNYSPAFPLHDQNQGYTIRLEHPREFYSGMAMPRPEHLDTNVLLQHPGPLIGLQQVAEGFGTPRPPGDVFGNMGKSLRPMPQPDGFNPQMGHQLRPLYLSEFGHPMGMPPMTVSRFHDGHLPPPPAGPPKRTMFNGLRPTTGPSLGELIVDYGWGPGNLSNFGGSGGGQHAFPGWLPAANS